MGGLGGGSGTHGEFSASFTTDFNPVGAIATDGTSLPPTSVSTAVSVPGRFPFVVADVDSLSGQTVTVTDGVFQFSKFTIPNGIVVRFEGLSPRAYSFAARSRSMVCSTWGIERQRQLHRHRAKGLRGLQHSLHGTRRPTHVVGRPGRRALPDLPAIPLRKTGGPRRALGGDGGPGGDVPLNTPAYPADKAALFKSFHGGNGGNALPFPGIVGPVAGGGNGTRGVPVNLVGPSQKEVYGNVNDVGVAGGFTFDNCAATGCSDPNPTLSDGITWFLTGTNPNSTAIHIGAPAGGGASNATDGNVGFWCNETVVTAN